MTTGHPPDFCQNSSVQSNSGRQIFDILIRSGFWECRQRRRDYVLCDCRRERPRLPISLRCFGSPGGSLPRSFRLTCCAWDLPAGCSCPFSSNTMPCCAALRSGVGMPACPPCLPPISCGPSKSLAFDISTSRCGSVLSRLIKSSRFLPRYGEPSLSCWKTAPAAGQRLEPSFHRMRYGGIATPGRSYQA
jgi:hypothetical protein